MTSVEVRKLRTALEKDMVDNDDQVRAQVTEGVKEWLLDRARELASETHIFNRAELLEVIRIHAETALLERLIQKPGAFSVRELREVLKDVTPVTGADAAGKVDPMTLIASLDIDGAEKGKLIAALADVAKANIRGHLGKGRTDVGSTEG